MTSRTKYAVTYTVKNESRLLPLAIKYFLAAGCERIYVYLDNTTDNTKQLVESFEKVVVLETEKPQSADGLPQWIIDILPWWEGDIDVRKCINTYFAAKDANSRGIDWIASIDPDELIIPDAESIVGTNMIARFLNSVPSKYNHILMRNLELIPSGAESKNPFQDNKLFIRRFPLTEEIVRFLSALIRRLVKKPKIEAWFVYYFYKCRFANAFSRLMIHPVTNEKIPAGYFLGYSSFKSFVRTEKYDVFKFATHKWIPYTEKPRTFFAGNVLHYDLFDYKYLADKFNKRPKTMMLEVFYFRYKLATVVLDSSLEQLRAFFLQYIAITDADKANKLMKKGIVQRIDFIAEFFQNSDRGNE